jgi:hypothetical protein
MRCHREPSFWLRCRSARSDLCPEVAECRVVGRHRVIGEEASDDLRQPRALLGNGLVHPPSQFLPYLPERAFRARVGSDRTRGANASRKLRIRAGGIGRMGGRYPRLIYTCLSGRIRKRAEGLVR